MPDDLRMLAEMRTAEGARPHDEPPLSHSRRPSCNRRSTSSLSVKRGDVSRPGFPKALGLVANACRLVQRPFPRPTMTRYKRLERFE
jgi:hypothetical protein